MNTQNNTKAVGLPQGLNGGADKKSSKKDSKKSSKKGSKKGSKKIKTPSREEYVYYPCSVPREGYYLQRTL